jgi:hypothetical protein
VAELAVSKRDLAWLRTGRRMLPLFGRSRLCSVGAGLNSDVVTFSDNTSLWAGDGIVGRTNVVLSVTSC